LTRILIIEDDASILLGLEKSLKFYGYDVICARDGESGLGLAMGKESPDLIILDIMLPKLDGYQICRRLRESKIGIPIIMLTVKEQEMDKVKGLELGADDYVTKPFSLLELQARIKAVLRRTRGTEERMGSFAFGDVEIDFDGRIVTREGKELDLSQREFDLLTFLISNSGRVLRRETILDEVWGYDYYGTLRTVDTFITHLRQKLEKDSANPQYILTVRGIGYKFSAPAD
jgi:DNA-binding response OmpR family regulator